MICVLPVARALAATCFISHGDRNWPFLMFTGRPAEATFWMKSVCRHRKAGVCSTSTTEATSSIGVYSCTSVSTGTPSWRFTSASTFRPSSKPGPRKLVPEVRLALSKLDLKMNGIPSAEVISLSWPAVSSCSCNDSITHGSAIRKKGWSRPTSNPHSFIGLSLRVARFGVAGGFDEAGEQRVAVTRGGQELRMRLAGQEPRMRRNLDHLDQQAVHRLRRDGHAGLLHRIAVGVVEFVAVAMAFGHHILAVELVRQRARLQAAFLQAQAHGAAQVGIGAAALDLARGGTPLGDQRDGRIGATAVDLGGVGARQAGLVAQHVDHRGLHAVTDAEIRDAVFAGVFGSQHLAFEAAV